ncbi:HAD-IC family P-type ATPase [Wukongibacter baidiensis]|uniref:cation-translocating P-type ATPase n=1 Tax=Wukongibacter baidiensis TaxID=1723361 RepID=UPI003D7F2B6C
MREDETNLYLVTAIPGRIRIKIPDLYRNPNLAHKLQNSLKCLDGIYTVQINTYTKSLLLKYDCDKVAVENLLESIESKIKGYKLVVEQSREMFNSAASTNGGITTVNQIVEERYSRDARNKASLSKGRPRRTISSDYEEWYKMSIIDVKQMLKTDIQKGLTEEKIKDIFERCGPNEFEKRDKKSVFKMFIEQFEGFIMKILLGASVLSILLGQVADALTILTIVIVEAMLGVWQSYKAEKSLEALKQYASETSRVIRNGKVQVIPSTDIVPGDIICFEPGDMIPADARLIASSNLKVQEATLTGESEAVEKSHKVKYATDVPVAERKNMIFMGTNVVKGNGKAIVVETGMNTEMGMIAEMLNESNDELTPLQMDLEKLAKVITWGCIGISGVVVLSGLLNGQPALEMVRTGISLAIGAVPEGLTTVLAISLAFGVQRMAKKGAIIKKLPCVETLSCADVICTDKTGTLTTGQMTVTDISTLDSDFKVAGDGNSTQGDIYYRSKIIDAKKNKGLNTLITIASLCNNASYEVNSDDTMEIIGDPTEGALLALAEKAKFSLDHFECYTRVKEFAFDSELKKMTVICKDDSESHTINMKGAPDVVLSKCRKIIDGEVIREITEDDILKIQGKIDIMTGKAMRVIAFAYKEIDLVPEKDADIEKDLVFIGVTGMIDPPRPQVKSSIKKCHKAGIKVIMITGDHKKTAVAIGDRIDLFNRGGKVLTGKELDALSDEELAAIIDDVVVYARTSPHQKLRIVKALKEKGHIVAMTGDGVNDAPAIKASNIGIAMGKNGTDVTREAASIVITDDNFTTIVKAIEEGRGISGNVKKFIRYVLSGNIGEVLAILAASLFRLPTPLIASQILMVNLVTEGIPALALGVDPPYYNAMSEKPRDGKKSIFDRSLLMKILSRGFLMGLSAFGLFAGTYIATGNLIKARTLTYASIVTNQMFHVFDCRDGTIEKNKYVIPSVVISSTILVGSIYIPALAGLFGTCPLGVYEWLALLFMASIIGRLDFIKEKASRLVMTKEEYVAA